MPQALPTSTRTYDPAFDEARRDPEDAREPNDPRGEFEIDRARIIHSAAFRRLQGKTQVLGIGEGDFYRTRLTHSMEAAQIGKGLVLHLNAAFAAGLCPELVEAACLAHDLGHPPFGHNGEHALQRCMWNHGGFESNAQMLRIVARLEPKRRGHGLNLTRATLDALLKYPVPYAPPDPEAPEADRIRVQKCFYVEDLDLVRWVRAGDVDPAERSLESEVMEWADDVAYSVHDLEDGLVAGFITEEKVLDGTLVGYLADNLPRRLAKCGVPAPDRAAVEAMLQEFMGLYAGLRRSHEEAAKRALTSRLIHRFVTAAHLQPEPEARTPYRLRLRIPAEARAQVEALKLVVQRLVIEDVRVVTMEWKGRTIVRRLYEELVTAPRKLLPETYRRQLDGEAAERVVCDYLAGMTDAYAMRLYARMLEPHAGNLYEVL